MAEDIEAKDGRVFGCTARSAYNGEVQRGEVLGGGLLKLQGLESLRAED